MERTTGDRTTWEHVHNQNMLTAPTKSHKALTECTDPGISG